MCAAARVQEPVSLAAPETAPTLKKPVQQMADDRRTHARLPIHSSVRVKRVSGRPEPAIHEFEGMDVSCSGIRFRADREFQPGTPMDLEVVLLDRRKDGQNVKMFTSAHVVRSEASAEGGWHAIAVAFDDIAISREAVR